MVKRLFFILLFIIGLLQARVAIVTGGKGGTYYPFGQQIAQECGYTVGGLDVIPTNGSLDNIKRLLKDPNVKFAIVQYDVLLYLLNNGTPKDKEMVRKLRIVMPLYAEDIHVLARKDINFKDIKNSFRNLRVSVGKIGSGTFVTAKNFVKYSGIRWAKTYAYDIKKSIKKIINGELDVAFYVAGAPVKILNVDQNNNPQVFELYKNNLQLLDLSALHSLDKIYSTSEITLSDYKWLDKPITTKAVKSVLITYNYKPYQPSYKRVANLYKCLYNKINEFQTNPKFHPKWQEVDPTDFRGINWKVHPAVLEFLNKLEGGKNNIEDNRNSNKNTEVLDNFFNNL